MKKRIDLMQSKLLLSKNFNGVTIQIVPGNEFILIDKNGQKLSNKDREEAIKYLSTYVPNSYYKINLIDE